MDDGEPAIVVRGLRKAYGDTAAVDGVDLDVAYGEIFALLGPNGAGKTTTVEILEGYRKRDAGELRVLGVDPGQSTARLRERVGIVLQGTGEFDELTVGDSAAAGGTLVRGLGWLCFLIAPSAGVPVAAVLAHRRLQARLDIGGIGLTLLGGMIAAAMLSLTFAASR